jgi:hypothetical protein
MAGLADHINDGPVVLPPLKVRNIQFCRFFPAKPASQEDSEQRSISLTLERTRVRDLQECFRLIGSEPITKANAEILRTFYSADASSEIRTQQARIGSFIREAPHGGEPAVDRARRKLTRFQVNSIAGHNGFVEREPRFGAVPSHEFVYCVSVSPLGFLRG